MRFRTRNNKGATTIALVLVLAFFVILPCGLLGYEISRFLLIEQMLRGATNAAALAGSAAMASSDMSESFSNREDWAMYIAGYTFQQNSIMSTPLAQNLGASTGTPNTDIFLYGMSTSGTAGTGSTDIPYTPMSAPVGATPSTSVPAWHTPSYREAALNVCLVNSSNQIVNDQGATNDQTAGGTEVNGVASQVVAIGYYSDRPSFASDLLPIKGDFTAVSVSRGGLPILDMDMLYDCSASMDDESPVLFVNRYWDINAKQVHWSLVNNKAPGLGAGSIPNNTIFECLGPNVTGSQVNIIPPQNLDQTAYSSNKAAYPNQTGNTWYPTWSECWTSGYTTNPNIGLRSGYKCNNAAGTPTQNGNKYTALSSVTASTAFEQGLPPGNFDYQNPGTTYGTATPTTAATLPCNGVAPEPFTDLVYDVVTATAAGNAGNKLFQNGASWQGRDLVNSNSVNNPSYAGPASASISMGDINGGQLAFLTEAARGNLESKAIFQRATGQVEPNGTTPTPGVSANNYSNLMGLATGGWYNAYWSYVVNNAQPFATARVAAYEFFQTMAISANSHFGLICFSDSEVAGAALSNLSNDWGPPTTAGSTPYSPATDYVRNVDGCYGLGNGLAMTNSDFRLPGVGLNPTSDNWSNGNVTRVLLGGDQTGYVPNANAVCYVNGNTVNYYNNSPQDTSGAAQNPACILAYGETDIAGALTSADYDITHNQRPTATSRAVVLFTDGLPDVPSYSSGVTSSFNIAKTIGQAGIPIFTIGLATNSNIQQFEDCVLSDDNTAGFSGGKYQGIAYQAKNAGASKSAYFPATTASLNQAFQAVARSLCILQ